jgi:beta-galactosidase
LARPERAFLHHLVDRLHDSPVQRKFRRLAPMPAGVVVVQTVDQSLEDLRQLFRTIRALGFNCLSGLHVLPGSDVIEAQRLALAEGLVPFAYADAGCEGASEDLLEKLGIDPLASMREVRADVRFIGHQAQLLRRRIDRQSQSPEVSADGMARIPFSFDEQLGNESAVHFTQWLREHYGTLEALSVAWNMNRALVRRPAPMWASWQDVERHVIDQVQSRDEYRRVRDVLRYKADVYLGIVQERTADLVRFDHQAPARAGEGIDLSSPFASRATDMEGVAEAMRYAGTFAPSLRLVSDADELDGELVRPVYIHASLAADWFKGGWSATFDCIAGPTLTGATGPNAQGVVMDGGAMQQVLLSCIAAGLKGFGLSNWNSHTAGRSAGARALTDRQSRPGDRAIEAGRIARACNRYRDELWASAKEPLLGVYTDFDTDCYSAAMALAGDASMKHQPMQTRVGTARALINGNVPWEFVTGKNLDMGLADRYRTIYLPGIVAISYDRLELLKEFVQSGGRLVMDLPGGWHDDFGRLLNTAAGSLFEQIFGCAIRDFQRSQPGSGRSRAIGDVSCGNGFVVDLQVTTGTTTDKYDDGSPAIVENQLGNGSAVFVGAEVSRLCHRPGNHGAEVLLRGVALGGTTLPFACENAIVYRRWSPQADHYFLINDGASRDVKLDPRDLRYSGFEDAVSGERVHPMKLTLRANGARWIRAIR